MRNCISKLGNQSIHFIKTHRYNIGELVSKDRTMKAIIYKNYGAPEVLKLVEIPKPIPKDAEILIRIHATTVSSGDWRARSLDLPAGFGFLGRLVFGLFGPRQPILGQELSGVVEAIGAKVTRFAVGDEVVAYTSAKFGCHAEYRTLPETGWVTGKPKNLSFQEAAPLFFGGTTALNFLRDKGGLKRGEKVLIVGASGSVGSAAVQIAKHFGAEVTGVCSTANLELVRTLGADKVIDYTVEDFTRNGQTYDIILNANGDVSLARCEALLKPGGRLLLVLGSFAQTLGLERAPKASGKKVISGVASVRMSDILELVAMAEAGDYTPVIERSFPLEQAARAHAYVDTGRKRGNIVLTVAPQQALALAAQ